ncbi:hypothetical protein GGR52DRAFT_296763 [Hypoxylon sp. FL1284]|nr:hypothetical protein GGR52DRAFT_296763 [Hypoxylon sp. FL1284]
MSSPAEWGGTICKIRPRLARQPVHMHMSMSNIRGSVPNVQYQPPRGKMRGSKSIHLHRGSAQGPESQYRGIRYLYTIPYIYSPEVIPTNKHLAASKLPFRLISISGALSCPALPCLAFPAPRHLYPFYPERGKPALAYSSVKNSLEEEETESKIERTSVPTETSSPLCQAFPRPPNTTHTHTQKTLSRHVRARARASQGRIAAARLPRRFPAFANRIVPGTATLPHPVVCVPRPQTSARPSAALNFFHVSPYIPKIELLKKREQT